MVKQVGKYVLEQELGQGAMGSVWLSSHPGLGIKVAVKILDHKLLAEDPEYLNRFIKEGNLAASINHQNVVRVLDAGHDGSTFYIVMELIEGADAKQLLESRGALPPSEVLELAINTAQALREAHNKGIVHRDIKPDNILVTNDGNIKLADLGIAKQLDDDYGSTMAGIAIGTPYYIAPEQAMDSSTVDARCDIYSLGATMYHLLTGSLPFPGNSAMSILMKHTQEELEQPQSRRPDLKLPDNICNLICKMMEKSPDNRYQNCAELLKALNTIKNHKSSDNHSKKRHFSAPSKKRKVEAKEKSPSSSRSEKPVRTKSSKKKNSAFIAIIAGITTFTGTLLILFIFFKSEKKELPQKENPVELSSNPAKDSLKETSSTNNIDQNVIGAFGGFSPASETKDETKELRHISKEQSKAMLIDSVNSDKIQLNENFTIFCEFKVAKGTIFTKTGIEGLEKEAKILYMEKDKIHFSTIGKGLLVSKKNYNDGKYHRVLVKSSNGKVEMHIDGELADVKNFTAKDKEGFRLKVACTQNINNLELKGHVMFISFWNSSLPNIRIKDLFRGSGAPQSSDFYYSEESYNPESERAKKEITRAVAQLQKDNPGLKVPEKRIKIEDGEINLNLANLPIKNYQALRGLKLKTLNLWLASVHDSSFLKDIKLEKLEALMLKSGSISLKHLNPVYLKELKIVKTKVNDFSALKNFKLKALSIDYQTGLISHIKHMPLETLVIADCVQTSFSDLNKNTLQVLRLYQTKGFNNIFSLKDFKLKEFHISQSPIDSIYHLKDMPLEQISLPGTKVKNLTHLAGKNITSLIIPSTCENLGVIKSLKSLKKVAIPRNLWTKELSYLKKTNIIIEGYGAKRGWWIDWGIITRRKSDIFWTNFDKEVK